MIPIPGKGILRRVDGEGAALAVDGITGLRITIHIGGQVVPLPEGDRYLGFIFASGETPEAVENSLRAAHKALSFEIEKETVPA
jgi:hypothetical protein